MSFQSYPDPPTILCPHKVHELIVANARPTIPMISNFILFDSVFCVCIVSAIVCVSCVCVLCMWIVYVYCVRRVLSTCIVYSVYSVRVMCT